MYADADGPQKERDSLYTGPLVVGAFAVEAAVAGGISEALGAESPANTSFTFATTCVIAALGGAMFAYRKGRRSK